jgi:PEP-CTERM motif
VRGPNFGATAPTELRQQSQPTNQTDCPHVNSKGVSMNQNVRQAGLPRAKAQAIALSSPPAHSSAPKRTVSLVAALLLCAVAPTAFGGEVYVTGAERKKVFNNGLTTAKTVDKGSYAEGNAYEFVGGVGASAFASTKGIIGAASQAGAYGKAFFSDSFRVTLEQVADVGDATSFLLTVPIITSGTATINWQPSSFNPSLSSSGQAGYEYNWSVLNASGSGRYRISKPGSRPETIIDTTNGSNTAEIRVTLGQVVPLRLYASADILVGAFAGTGASGAADFGHTLRWGGVSSISAFNSAGQSVALPENFNLSLVSDTTGFDYRNAAGPNPFTTTPVPEPETYAMLLAGLGLVGAIARRRNAKSVS